jgi:hypothetical protein
MICHLFPIIINSVFKFEFREMSKNSYKCSSIHFFQSRLLGATKIVLSTPGVKIQHWIEGLIDKKDNIIIIFLNRQTLHDCSYI